MDPEGRMAFTQSDSIEVKRAKGKGRGVFARRPIPRGETIERVPVLLLPAEEVRDAAGWAGLAAYCFEWGRGTLALALGYGSLYNHSYRPNARYDDSGPQTKVFTALRDIAPGEEITVNYNGDPEDDAPVGFKVVEGVPPQQTSGPVSAMD
jgi:SET domain-containing protein